MKKTRGTEENKGKRQGNDGEREMGNQMMMRKEEEEENDKLLEESE